MFSYLLRDFSKSRLKLNGTPSSWEPANAGNIHVYDLREEIEADLKDPLDFVFLYLPKVSLDSFAEEHDLRPVRGLCPMTGSAFFDPVVAGLGLSALAVIRRPEDADQVYIDQLAFCLQAHFLQHYARTGIASLLSRGGLAPWQERLAKDALSANLDGRTSIEEVAQDCNLSRSHFFRAFRQSTGKTPHQWLLERRYERARFLLLTSALPLEDIARQCGFAGLSHFSRVFTRQFGTSPAAWRRQLGRRPI